MSFDFYAAFTSGRVHHSFGVFIPAGADPEDLICENKNAWVVEFDPSISGQEEPVSHVIQLTRIIQSKKILSNIPEALARSVHRIDVGEYSINSNNCRHFLAFVFRYLQLNIGDVDDVNDWDVARKTLKHVLMEARYNNEQRIGGVALIAAGMGTLAGLPLMMAGGAVLAVAAGARVLFTSSDHLDMIFQVDVIKLR